MTQEQPVIDMQSVTFFEPFALIYLGMFLRFHNAAGRMFLVRPPSSNRARSYMESQNFLERFNFDKKPDESVFRCFGLNTSFNDIVDLENRVEIADEIGLRVRDLLRNNSTIRVNVGLVETLVVELVDNFQQHADAELAACTVQWYPKLNRIDFAIGDCGVGIRSSLSKKDEWKYLVSRSHRDAAVMALEPLVSRKSEGGMGLTEVKRARTSRRTLFLVYRGWMGLGSSGRDSLWAATVRFVWSADRNINSNGDITMSTQIEVDINRLSDTLTTRRWGSVAYAALSPMLEDGEVVLYIDESTNVSTSFLDGLLLRLREADHLRKVSFMTANSQVISVLRYLSGVRSIDIYLLNPQGELEKIPSEPQNPLRAQFATSKPEWKTGGDA